jgi:hypothetical protein
MAMGGQGMSVGRDLSMIAIRFLSQLLFRTASLSVTELLMSCLYLLAWRLLRARSRRAGDAVP